VRIVWRREDGPIPDDWTCLRSEPELEARVREIGAHFRECGTLQRRALVALERAFRELPTSALACLLLEPDVRSRTAGPSAIGLGFAALRRGHADAVRQTSLIAGTSIGCEAARRYQRALQRLEDGVPLRRGEVLLRKVDLIALQGEICERGVCAPADLGLHLPILSAYGSGARLNLWTGEDWSP
jgi:hypothetical protein